MGKKRLLTEEENKQIGVLKYAIEEDMAFMTRIAINIQKISEMFRNAGYRKIANKLESIGNGVNNSAGEVADALKYQVS